MKTRTMIVVLAVLALAFVPVAVTEEGVEMDAKIMERGVDGEQTLAEKKDAGGDPGDLCCYEDVNGNIHCYTCLRQGTTGACLADTGRGNGGLMG